MIRIESRGLSVDRPNAEIFQRLITTAADGQSVEAKKLLMVLEARLQEDACKTSGHDNELLKAIKSRYGLKSSPAQRPAGAQSANLAPAEISGSKPGVSLVTCCMNRNENLLRAMTSWLALDEINEIVIVDWTSDEPVLDALGRQGISDARIRVIRAEEEPRWVLSYAFNLGFRYARYDKILKVDADIVLSEDFFTKNKLLSNQFIAGAWELAKKGQEHINGFFFASSGNLNTIRGFNEYITTYGWDDDDIYSRIQRIGVKKVFVDTETVHHLDHDDQQRLGCEEQAVRTAWQELRKMPMFSIRRNRFIANVMPVWNENRRFAPFRVLETAPGFVRVRRLVDKMRHRVGKDIENDSFYYAAYELLSWQLGVRVFELSREQLDTLLNSKPLDALTSDDVQTLLDAPEQNIPAPSVHSGKARLFVDPQHGLGNRLRAIGSAAAIADKTDRELVIVWQPDHHCEGTLSDLFDYDGAVIEETFVEDAGKSGCSVFNYMEVEEGEKGGLIDPALTGDIYVRSAYVLNSPFSSWDTENRFLRNLSPVERVQELVRGVRTPNDVSAHVRMVGGTDYEHLAYEAVDNWTEEGHAETDFWRKKSHFSHFIKRLDSLIAEGKADRIFLAADKPETYDVFVKTFGDKVAFLPRELYDRSAEQLQYALADALLLGTSPLLLGSSWSSFSELAMRLSPHKMIIEMSGKDF